MGHTFTRHLYHLVFSTKGRQRLIDARVRDRLCQYVRAVARRAHGEVLRINAMEDHVHLLTEVKPDISVARFVGAIKANSSRWVSQTFTGLLSFSWQAGYSSFTVSESNWKRVAAYIDGQQEHHRKDSFDAELARLLQRHGVAFDATRYLD